ncbi:MAG: toll/interleukin-1 receptor domain-containing protein [Rhodoglobus sp.]
MRGASHSPHGLAHSTFGVVVFSKSFFAQGWPQYELDGIVDLSVAGKQRMLPIWHEVSKDEVQRHSPSLADKIARNTAISTIAEIAHEIAEVVNETKVADSFTTPRSLVADGGLPLHQSSAPGVIPC